ncbi:MAG: L-histidine N(alpha)-methyltransferase [Proteobacteria bacterium]|nr:L-histidine N(alpha)-methyltransferase [Pseudomonadota bacterium]
MTHQTPTPRVLTLLTEDWAAQALAEDVRRALATSPHILSPRWLYDSCGSALFEAITRLEPYYPFRAERQLLADHAAELLAVACPDAVVELGAGSSEKTRQLLDAAEGLEHFMALDVSASAIGDALPGLAQRYPSLSLSGVVGDFSEHLHATVVGERRMVVFLGGTVGNFYPDERRDFFRAVAESLRPAESLLLGVDLVKEPRRLVAAYDDPQGVTAAFNKNVLAVVNRALDADFDLRDWSHVARWDAEHQRMALSLVPSTAQRVRVKSLDIEVQFEAGEALHTEISTKFRLPALQDELRGCGLAPTRVVTDGDVALVLATR